MNKIYAYVTSQTCSHCLVFRPGEYYQQRPVSKHGDLEPWYCGKKLTAILASHGQTEYTRESARKVLQTVF